MKKVVLGKLLKVGPKSGFDAVNVGKHSIVDFGPGRVHVGIQ